MIMKKAFIAVAVLLFFNVSNVLSQTVVTLNEFPIDNIDPIFFVDDESFSALDADYAYIRKSDNHFIFEKDGVIVKDIDVLENSTLINSNNLQYIDAESVHVFSNKYLKNNNVEILFGGRTLTNKDFYIVTDENATIYFEELDHRAYNFTPTSIRMYHTVGSDSFIKYVKFDTSNLSKKDENLTSYKVYPNPTSNFINIEGDFESIKIYDLSGKLIMTKNTSDKTIDVSSLAKGEYVLKLYTQSNTVGSHKIIID